MFFSVSDGSARARVCHVSEPDFASAWRAGAAALERLVQRRAVQVRWLRVDWVKAVRTSTVADWSRELARTKRNYYRYGVAFDKQMQLAFLEQELNGNAMLYGGNTVPHAQINPHNFKVYAATRFGAEVQIDLGDEREVYILTTQGLFRDVEEQQSWLLYGAGRHAGRRVTERLAEQDVMGMIARGSRYLATQVQDSGVFHYGWHPCFDRPINAYNSLRHASTTYAMIEAWEVTGDDELKRAIDRSLDYLTGTLIAERGLAPGQRAAFLVDGGGSEVKLGGNAVCLLALSKYAAVTGTSRYHALMESLALGILHMQDPVTGRFSHVLNYPDLSVKDPFRIIYYDGEAAFGLMRLYGLTGDARWLEAVVKAFDYFMAAEHWKAHDHWLSYCVNELTSYRPELRYFEFGIKNVAGYLDFVRDRITTFPTLLELMMAAEAMLHKLPARPDTQPLLDSVDIDAFYVALERRAHYLQNGHFWPEYAMFFRNPRRIVGSFFIRHHAFRVRIDDVEHYLSGLVAYLKYLRAGGRDRALRLRGA
ncbi:MAG: Mur ligase [Pigmentiphaga sp.]|uniref:Mur ligase n=1 Tax=Pigmentiphaga sp. TaxID=1977564 RepID=UPI0029AD2675|nr:Mur ligase [Pigmentiphaga sp.]MDX3906508.1 Mur ligase [Pigmentiphaga sp.]